MPWFIIESERKTWTKYVVEAEDEDAALDACDEWSYIGYVDGDDEKSSVVQNRFKSRTQALDDVMARVDG